MSNDIASVRDTKAKVTRLMRLKEASEYFHVGKATMRKLAMACGAYYPYSKTLVFVEPKLVEEYLRTARIR